MLTQLSSSCVDLPPAEETPSSSLSQGAVIGIAVGVTVVGAAIAAAVSVIIWRHMKSKRVSVYNIGGDYRESEVSTREAT